MSTQPEDAASVILADEPDLTGLNTRVYKTHKQALRLATMTGRTVQDIVNDALREYLQDHYPAAWAAVGNPAAINRVAADYSAQRQAQAAA